MQSYEAFLSKKYRIGKKTLFLNRDLTEEAKENMMEHMKIAEQKKLAKVQGRIEELAEQKREAELNSEQIKDMKTTELAMKKNLIKTNVEAIETVKAERNNTKNMQKQYDKQFGFNHFPFTHGEQLEKAQRECSEAYKAEMQAMRALKNAQEEEQGIYPSITPVSPGPSNKPPSEDGERSGINNPLVKTTQSADRPRAREGMGGFKNQKQEDFVAKLLQKTPFYANKHTNHLCKGLNWEAQNSVVLDARKRFEQGLLLNKQKDMEDEKMLKELEAENERFQTAQ